ncbi:unnamed protein product [Protopolystoma xenopodis]|uniref:Myb-like domain-containing protein n=1 Tax=Protopolystoma xenopodis TaxID=117903 RepID=A0A3S5B1V0_9PLAT|nr:unnamed protein product [Protopolystoma xenopodis]
MEECPSKSPEKSSPSFPEDAEDDDEDNGEIIGYQMRSPDRNLADPNDINDGPNDVTMVADDDDEPNRPSSCAVDSPRHPADPSDKKVHWTNANIQTLLDYVEKHLEEFNVHKKHKQVWQAIGSEMEHLGFTTEHCYNKWKNLRRDVRLLVNNPQKAVRNADILRRVARLILIIYPNVDATTMQVCSDRTGIRSTPCTPGGLGSSTVKSLPTMAHPPDSPAFHRLANCTTPRSSTPSHYSNTPHTLDHKPYTNGLHSSNDNPVPGTVLFTNLGPNNPPSVNKFINISPNENTNNSARVAPAVLTSANQSSSPEVDTVSQTQPNLPFLFSPAAAALLVQSQFFTDLIRQQQRVNETESAQSTNGHPSHTPDLIPISTILQAGVQSVNGSGLHGGGSLPAVSLAATLLNGLVGSNAPSLSSNEDVSVGTSVGSSATNGLMVNVNALNGLVTSNGSGELNLPSSTSSRMSIDPTCPLSVHTSSMTTISAAAAAASILERIPPGSELACVVERLRDEEAVHVRLTDMVAHIADELRAAGQRRQAALEQLLTLVKAGSVVVSSNSGGTRLNNGTGANLNSLFHGQTATADTGGMA